MGTSSISLGKVYSLEPKEPLLVLKTLLKPNFSPWLRMANVELPISTCAARRLGVALLHSRSTIESTFNDTL